MSRACGCTSSRARSSSVTRCRRASPTTATAVPTHTTAGQPLWCLRMFGSGFAAFVSSLSKERSEPLNKTLRAGVVIDGVGLPCEEGCSCDFDAQRQIHCHTWHPRGASGRMAAAKRDDDDTHRHRHADEHGEESVASSNESKHSVGKYCAIIQQANCVSGDGGLSPTRGKGTVKALGKLQTPEQCRDA